MSARPSAGVRYVLDRGPAEGGAGGWVYRGFAHERDREVPIELRVEGAGAVTLADHASGGRAGAATAAWQGSEAGDAELGKAAVALVKAAVKAALAAGREPPRRIVRWRG